MLPKQAFAITSAEKLLRSPSNSNINWQTIQSLFFPDANLSSIYKPLKFNDVFNLPMVFKMKNKLEGGGGAVRKKRFGYANEQNKE